MSGCVYLPYITISGCVYLPYITMSGCDVWPCRHLTWVAGCPIRLVECTPSGPSGAPAVGPISLWWRMEIVYDWTRRGQLMGLSG